MSRDPGQPRVFDLALGHLELECGARVEPLRVRGWWWGPSSDLPALEERTRLRMQNEVGREAHAVVRRTRAAPLPARSGGIPFDPGIPTVVVVHTLTSDMRVGGSGGWWAPLVGLGAPLDPRRFRIVCFNNLGSCYGTSGPADEGFPTATDPRLPAPLTTWDQARTILAALDALGLERLHLVTGGSLGGLVTLCLAALAPDRIERIAPIASAEAASAWVIGWNHVARQAVLLDPAFPDDAPRGLAIARSIAMLTYRTEAVLHAKQGRLVAGTDQRWNPETPFRIHTYLDHHGTKLRKRFDARAYLAQLGAMDHHDLARAPAPGSNASTSTSWGLDRIRASTLAIHVDSDQLFLPAHSTRLTERLRAHGLRAEDGVIHSPYGHDAYLVECDQVATLLHRALALPSGID